MGGVFRSTTRTWVERPWSGHGAPRSGHGAPMERPGTDMERPGTPMERAPYLHGAPRNGHGAPWNAHGARPIPAWSALQRQWSGHGARPILAWSAPWNAHGADPERAPHLHGARPGTPMERPPGARPILAWSGPWSAPHLHGAAPGARPTCMERTWSAPPILGICSRDVVLAKAWLGQGARGVGKRCESETSRTGPSFIGGGACGDFVLGNFTSVGGNF